MRPVEIKPDIYWVGAIDWAVRDFHGYITPYGTTYNNYLIKDRDITLIDAVKSDFIDITMERIKGLVEPSKVKNLIINHIEPDHASGIGQMIRYMPNATIYITERGKKGLERHFDTSGWEFKVVKSKETINIGKHTLTFLETPMLHWPDSMMTYVNEAKLLISQDAFGQHLASAARFDDEFIGMNSEYELDDAVVDYYANILMPFGQLIKTKIEEVVRFGIEIDMIAPDHGVIWRKDPKGIIKRYLDMAEGKAELGIVIIYDTMWHSTEQMVIPVMEGIREEGVKCKVIKLRATPMSYAVKELWKVRGCLVGVPTINNQMFPSLAEFLYHLAGLKPKARVMGAFGSYGWSGGAVKEAYEYFKKMGIEVFEPGLQVQYRPFQEDLNKCHQFGMEFAKFVKEYDQRIMDR